MMAKAHCTDRCWACVQEGVSLVFLSARPESYKGLTEAESFRHFFTPLLTQRRLFCTPVLLLGSLQAGPQAALSYVIRRRWG